MGQYDGEIRINTKISVTEAKLQLRQLQGELAKVDKTIAQNKKNLEKIAPKLAEYEKEKAWIRSARKEEMAQTGMDDVQAANVDAKYALMMENLDAKYASVLQKQQEYNDELDTATRKQSELTGKVQEAQQTLEKAVMAEQRQKEASKQAAQAKKEQAAAEKESLRLARQAERASRGLERSATRVGRKFLTWGTAMLAVRGVMGILRKSVQAFLDDNVDVANQIASVWGVLGNVLGPIIQRIVNMISTVISVIAAFIKALTGIDIVANYNAKALDKQAGATAGAGAAAEKAEKQLAGFDEMNKLTDTSSGAGGGGGGGGADLKLFEPVELSDELQAKIEWVAAHFKDILWYAAAIGAAIGTWAILDSFLPVTLKGRFEKILGIAIAVAGAILLIKGYTDAWQNGIDFQNMIEMFGGLAIVVGGLAIAFGPVVAAVAALVGGVAAVVLALREWITTGELSAETCAVLTTGIMLIGGALMVLTGSWIPLLIAAVIAAVVTIIAYWDKIKAAWNTVVEWIRAKWEELVQNISDFFTMIDETTDAWADACVETITTWASNTKQKISDMVSNGKARFEDFKQDTITKFQNMRNKANETFTNITSSISTAVDNAKQKFDDMKDKVLNVWDIIKSKFTSLGSVIGSAISGAIKTAINNVLSLIQNKINSAVNLINGVIGVINAIPGVSVGYLSTVSLPRLAKGGIVNNPGMGVAAVIGEAGKEAVLPLERNTGWMDTLADKIASRSGASGQVVVPVYLSGRKIAEYVIDLTKQQAFATNRA